MKGKIEESTQASVIRTFHQVWLWIGWVSLTQNEAVQTSAAGLEAQFNELESNGRIESGGREGSREANLMNLSFCFKQHLLSFCMSDYWESQECNCNNFTLDFVIDAVLSYIRAKGSPCLMTVLALGATSTVLTFQCYALNFHDWHQHLWAPL